MSWIIDTNILSELARPRPHPSVDRWVRSQTQLHISTITVEEIEFGLAWRPKPRIHAWWCNFVAEHCVVHPVSEGVARRAGQFRGQLQAAGLVRTQADMLIAATAAERGSTLVTRNAADFTGCGIAVFNPFEEEHIERGSGE